MKKLSDKLLDILEQKKILDKAQLKKILSIHKRKGGTIGKILISENIITHKDLMAFLSEQLNIPPIDLSKYKISPEVIKLIPEKMARQYKLIPIST